MVVELVGAPPLGPLFAEARSGVVLRLWFDEVGESADAVDVAGVAVSADVPGVAGHSGVGGDDTAERDVVRRLEAAVASWCATGDARADALVATAIDLAPVGPFRAEVYRQLARVPPGGRVTYGDLARRAGRPGAARAVGRAMATNPWPLLIPCHRVVPAGGGVGHYAGGSARKAWMLSVEDAGGVAQAGP